MGKNKLQRFKENHEFPHVIQPGNDVLLNDAFEYKGKWANFFKNNNPIVLELGCGKGEYSVALAEKNPDINYIGVDIKGARIWRGAKTSFQKGLKNIAFLRIRIDQIEYCFSSNEVSEIWCTFSDPHLGKKKNITKRLASSKFLNKYKQICKNNSIIHLKTDDKILFDYTKEVAEFNKLNVLHAIEDIYKNDVNNIVPPIKTYYEEKWLEKGKLINYISFTLPKSRKFKEPAYNYEREKEGKV